MARTAPLILIPLLLLGCNSGSGGAGSGASAGGSTSAPTTSGSTGSPASSSAGGPSSSSLPGGPASQSGSYEPSWAQVQPLRTLRIDHDPARSAAQNGAALVAALRALQPGDRLEVGGGTWSIESYFDLVISGRAAAPIWVVAQGGATPVLTRSNAQQNVLNLGQGGSVSYLCLRGLEITGGSAGLRLHQCSQVWVDACKLHDTQEVTLTANTFDTDHLFITRNEIYAAGGTGEGMYLGANNGAKVMRDSVIALNHVHDTAGSQGDGIEVKQGSYGNLIAENHVHDTKGPAIIAYGTGGQAPNVIERNTCYRSQDNTLQVQGEAIVRNNLLIGGASAFHSHDHQGQTRDLVVVHNTIVNRGRAMNLGSWNNRQGMVLANNAIYSQSAEAIRFANGSLGVTLRGNVILGSLVGTSAAGTTPGSGLADFANLSYDGQQRDARPSAGSPLIGAADAAHPVKRDLLGATRVAPLESGCVER